MTAAKSFIWTKTTDELLTTATRYEASFTRHWLVDGCG